MGSHRCERELRQTADLSPVYSASCPAHVGIPSEQGNRNYRYRKHIPVNQLAWLLFSDSQPFSLVLTPLLLRLNMSVKKGRLSDALTDN